MREYIIDMLTIIQNDIHDDSPPQEYLDNKTFMNNYIEKGIYKLKEKISENFWKHYHHFLYLKHIEINAYKK